MGLLSGNSCNIITLLPLGLDCDSVNASTPDSTNGVVALYITGGTPPYTISWSNGSQGSLITNLSPGEYTALVTDYYGDFSATTTCFVDYDSFYLEEFENCQTSEKIYYLADLPSEFISGKIYELTTQTGCWTSNGTLLYTTQTYYNSVAVPNEKPYDDCGECLPTPTPDPEYPDKLCLTYRRKIEGTFQTLSQTTFDLSDDINGQPSWTSSTQTIYYNSGNTTWNVLNWNGVGSPSFVTTSPPPIGLWTVNGGFNYFILVSSGDCTTPPMTLVLQKTDPTCEKSHNGTIIALVTDGVAPYTYSINGITYQSSNIFTNLYSGVYTIYVKDFNNNIVSQSITLTSQYAFETYYVNIVNTGSVQTQQSKTNTFKIEVTPTLPLNRTITFDIPITVLLSGTTFDIYQTTLNNTITLQQNGTSTITSPTTSPVVTGIETFKTNCNPEELTVYTSAYTETYGATITGSGFITGTITQEIITPTIYYNNQNNVPCPLYGEIKDTVNVTVLGMNPKTCSLLETEVTPISYGFQNSGIVIFSGALPG